VALRYGNSISWRCALHKKYGCHSRAVTETANPDVARITQKQHTHGKDAYICRKPKASKKLTANRNVDNRRKVPVISSVYSGNNDKIDHSIFQGLF
jgi:hypothetical protein